MSVQPLPIACATAAVAEAEAEVRRRLERKYRRRLLVRSIDAVIDLCELANRDGSGDQAPPAEAVALVAELQEAADEPAAPPATAYEALDELFRLQEAYLLSARFGDNDDQVADVGSRHVRSTR